MLGFTPYRFYYYMWKYITPILLLVLLCSSFIQLIMTPPSYSAWIQNEVSQHLRLISPLGSGINGGGSSLLLGKPGTRKKQVRGFKVNEAVAKKIKVLLINTCLGVF